jgi:hypothetical protein
MHAGILAVLRVSANQPLWRIRRIAGFQADKSHARIKSLGK